MLKKLLILAVAVAIGISPLLPRVFADSGAWSNTVASAAWDYDFYRVERLALDEVSGPYDFNDAVFVTKGSDITIFQDGEAFEIEGVDERVASAFWHTAQDGRFIYFVGSDDGEIWGTVYEFDSTTGTSIKLTDIKRDADDLSFMTFATDGDRVYFGTIHSDEDTGKIESKLSVYDYDSTYGRDDFTYTLTAPWQEIVDVQDGLALVKFQFSGGFEQLWLIDQTARSMEAIPDTWTQDPGEIVGAHFVSDGSIRFFRNYQLYAFTPNVDTTPRNAGGAHLSWYDDVADAVQIVGDRMAYVDEEHGLYVSDARGVSKFGFALASAFNLDEDAIYFQNIDGDYVGYHFSTREWEMTSFLVTDTYEDIRMGIDHDGNVWYENLTTGYVLNVGYGNEPVVLSDREHAYWQGADGNLYEVTFSPLLDLERENVEAFSSYTSDRIYLVADGSMWLIPDEVVYFTWFDSWDDTLEVSQTTIDVYLTTYEYKGDLKLAAGTRVKSDVSNKVYVVGSDAKLHWITTETVADEVFGSNWNQGIIEVTSTYLWKYATGSNIASTDDVRSI